jgi:DNA polymerase III delta prime subunit
MAELWLKKYCPKTTDDMVGNRCAIEHINKWISNINNEQYNSLIISGPHGIGKTLAVKLSFEENSYDPMILYPVDIKNHKFMETIIEMKNCNDNILQYMNTTQKKNGIVIDEAETITLTSEKNYIIELLKENYKKKILPIIFICNTQHSKLIEEIKKNCNEIRFMNPTFNELKLFIIKITNAENMKLTTDDVYKNLIDFCQYDIRRLILILQELNYTYFNEDIDEDKMNVFIKTSRKKDTDIGLFEASKMLLEKELPIKTIIQMYETEKVLLPLMVHENYYNQICTSNTEASKIINKNRLISESISIGDNIETSIYTDQNWYLQNMHGFFTCIFTSHHINKVETTFDIKFSSDLNKTSLKNINKKNISNINLIIPHKSIDEILMINHIINTLIRRRKFNTMIKLLRRYKPNLILKDIELCSKIDKTAPKSNIVKDKKMFQKMLKC